VDFIVTMTVEQLKIAELIVGCPLGAISIDVVNLQQIIGAKAESALGTFALLSIQQKDNSFGQRRVSM